MDFGFGKGSKGSMRRKSNSFLHSLSRNTTARASAIPFPTTQTSSQSVSLGNSSGSSYQTTQSGNPTPNVLASPTSKYDDAQDRTPNPYAHGGGHTSQSPETYQDGISTYSYAPNHGRQRTPSSAGRIPSGNVFGRPGTINESIRGSAGGSIAGSSGSIEKSYEGIKRPEDVFGVIKDRLFSWSYMMQWYQGDINWFGTVNISVNTIETHLGSRLDIRARNYLILGASLANQFDIVVMGDYLKAVTKLLDEWEAWTEGGAKGGVKGLFKGPKGKRDPMEPETYIAQIHLPFAPDFFQVHATLCSIVRDVYKKILGMILPADSTMIVPPNQGITLRPIPTSSDPLQSLFHKSTFIHSAHITATGPTPSINFNPALVNPNHGSRINYNSFSPETASIAGFATPSTIHHSRSNSDGRTGTSFGDMVSSSGIAIPTKLDQGGALQHDAFQALLAGNLPGDRTLVGDGQKLTPQLLDMFQRVDTRFRKHFSLLIREGDLLARKTLDDEINSVIHSLSSATTLTFDLSSDPNQPFYPNPHPNQNQNIGSSSSIGRSHRRYESTSVEGSSMMSGHGHLNNQNQNQNQLQLSNPDNSESPSPSPADRSDSDHNHNHDHNHQRTLTMGQINQESKQTQHGPSSGTASKGIDGGNIESDTKFQPIHGNVL